MPKAPLTLNCFLRWAGTSKVRFGWAMCGPPCGLFVFISSSFHQRSWMFPCGDQAKWKVRASNQLTLNLLVLLCIAHFREVFFLPLAWNGKQIFGNSFLVPQFQIMSELSSKSAFLSTDSHLFHPRLEQPASSLLWLFPELEALWKVISLQKVHSWMRCFGHALPKPSIFVGNINMEIMQQLYRKWSKRMEKRWKRAWHVFRFLGCDFFKFLFHLKGAPGKSKFWFAENSKA